MSGIEVVLTWTYSQVMVVAMSSIMAAGAVGLIIATVVDNVLDQLADRPE